MNLQEQEEVDAWFARADRFDGFDRGDLDNPYTYDHEFSEAQMTTYSNPRFDGYEIAPVAVWTYPGADSEFCDRCETLSDAQEEAEANGGYVIWTLYGHLSTGHTEMVADATLEGCARLLSSILAAPVTVDEEVGVYINLSEVPR